MTRTEWLEKLRGADRVTLQDVLVTLSGAYVPTPDEIAPYVAFLEELASSLREIVPDLEPPTPKEAATAPETAPAEEVIHA